MFKDKTLLITGGTGSFGNAVLSRFLKTAFKEIRIFSRDEKKQDDQKLGAVLQLIADIRKDARSKKDYATSDKIRDQLLKAGIQLKDEKDGGFSWELV
jgi:FlaA1/EpsC-like NDP-sugar epimerase